MATLNYPAWGYGLRYRYGIFKQEIVDGYQVEIPDYWLDFNPWEFPRHDITVDIHFYGYVRKEEWVFLPMQAIRLYTKSDAGRMVNFSAIGRGARL